MRDVILHAFNWTYDQITAAAGRIADAGYGAVLFPPPLYSEPSNPLWWQRYQPKDYRVVRSYLGDLTGLRAAVDALRTAGVRAYVDIVFNHMANEKSQRTARGDTDLLDFPGAYELARYRADPEGFERDRLYGNLDEGLFSHADFHETGDIGNWNAAVEVEDHWLSGLPDLELTPNVVANQRACLTALVGIGFSGFRIDALKHLPVDHLKAVFGDMVGKGFYVFGEALTTNDYEENLFLWPALRETGFPCYDFALFETLRRVFSPTGSMRELVDPSACGQALPWNRALTFACNHDLPYNETFRSLLMDPKSEYLASMYLLGRDGGVPLVLSDHGESVATHPEDAGRWADAFDRPDLRAGIRFHNALHGSPQRTLFEADGFLVLARGDSGILAINKTCEWQTPSFRTSGLRDGRYRCQIHGHELEMAGSSFTLRIPPAEAQLWLHA